MSADIDDGGPAFPLPHWQAGECRGMSLRDWLAGQALTGLLANPHASGDIGAIARGAYLQADAMLAELKRAD